MNKIYVVGLGPGGAGKMTAEAAEALKRADVLCGYTVYVELAKAMCPNKESFSTPMTKELDRCRWALETAAEGKTVAMVCSGDAGVYGMAGPLLQMAEGYKQVDIEVVPGVTAALAAAAAVGAPLAHDFCVISLSDLLTPWDLIKRRLECAAMGDFVICLYNPSSKRRADYLQKACDILLDKKSEDTVCAWARNVGREGESCKILTLKELAREQVDMFTTVLIGNSFTKCINGRMVTPRGYEEKV